MTREDEVIELPAAPELLVTALLRLRTERKWTQQDVADRLGHTTNTLYNKYEQGKIQPPPEAVAALERAFEVEPGTLAMLGNKAAHRLFVLNRLEGPSLVVPATEDWRKLLKAAEAHEAEVRARFAEQLRQFDKTTERIDARLSDEAQDEPEQKKR